MNGCIDVVVVGIFDWWVCKLEMYFVGVGFVDYLYDFYGCGIVD